MGGPSYVQTGYAHPPEGGGGSPALLGLGCVHRSSATYRFGGEISGPCTPVVGTVATHQAATGCTAGRGSPSQPCPGAKGRSRCNVIGFFIARSHPRL